MAPEWTEDEENIIITFKEYQCRPWAEIAAKLPGRGVDACRQRWKNIRDRAINDCFGYTTWTEEELSQLRSLYYDRYKDWVAIAQALPGHTPAACEFRYHQDFTNSALPMERSAWTEAEDQILLELRRKVIHWEQISSHFTDRNVNACRQRHRKILNRGQPEASKSAAEDKTDDGSDVDNGSDVDPEPTVPSDQITSQPSATDETPGAERSS